MLKLINSPLRLVSVIGYQESRAYFVCYRLTLETNKQTNKDEVQEIVLAQLLGNINFLERL